MKEAERKAMVRGNDDNGKLIPHSRVDPKSRQD